MTEGKQAPPEFKNSTSKDGASTSLVDQPGEQREDQFLAVLAHEFRNPMAAIRSLLEILRLAEFEDADIRRALEMMDRQIDRMTTLLEELLDVSRITRGRIEMLKEQVDVAAVLRNAVQAVQSAIAVEHLDLKVSLPTAPVLVHGDAARLGQVFAALLDNAVKFTPRAGQISVSLAMNDGNALVTFCDSGKGIQPDRLSAVFELFSKAGGATNRRDTEGLGKGLAVARSLVAMQGGTVTAHSDGLGRGSKFVVKLPLANAATASEDIRQDSAVVEQRVLIADDNRDAAESLGMLFEKLGAKVAVAFNGPDAIKALSTHHPTIVMLDIGMEGMDGYEVARRIRQRPEFRTVQLVALTGWGQEEDRRKARAAGFDRHLVKPATMDTLQSLLVAKD